MMRVLAAQEVGNIDGVLVGGAATVCQDVCALGEGSKGLVDVLSHGGRGARRDEMTYLQDLRCDAKDVAYQEDGCRGV